MNSQGLDSPFPGKIQSLEKIGDDFLISYLPSPDSGEQESWLKAIRGEGTSEFRQRIKEKMKTKTVLFRRDTKQLEAIDLPPMYYNSFKVIGEDIWWMKPLSSTVEAESFTVFKGKLEKENQASSVQMRRTGACDLNNQSTDSLHSFSDLRQPSTLTPL